MSTADTEPPFPFIVGVARSGTTMLRLMLDAHSELAIPPETHFLPTILSLREHGDGQRDRFSERVMSFFTWNDFGIDKQDFLAAVAELQPFDLAAGIRCFYRLYAGRQGKYRWGDKTPPYVNHVAAITECLAEAHIVHLIRDGRAVAASRRHLDFGPGPEIRAQAEDWSGSIRAARSQARSCRRYLEIHYEQLVSRPEATLLTICDFLGLPFESEMLSYYERAPQRLQEFRDWRTPDGDIVSRRSDRIAIHQGALRPPDPARIDHWRNELGSEEIAVFESVAADLLRDLGYDLY
jgi:hypothetical protein